MFLNIFSFSFVLLCFVFQFDDFFFVAFALVQDDQMQYFKSISSTLAQLENYTSIQDVYSSSNPPSSTPLHYFVSIASRRKGK
jgi:hypothetical protein